MKNKIVTKHVNKLNLRVTLATNGEPEMCLSANLTVMLYSPGAVGR